MQETHEGLLLTRREALAGHLMATERGYPQLGQAITRVMMDYYTVKDVNGHVRNQRYLDKLNSDGSGLRGILRGNVARPENFFHVPADDIEEASLESFTEACAPTENLEREIDAFEAFIQAEMSLPRY